MNRYLNRFEQKIIDDLAVSMADPYSKSEDIESQAIQAAVMLRCTPVQAAIAGAMRATAVLTVTPRHEGFFGADNGDFYFDLQEAKAILRASRY